MRDISDVRSRLDYAQGSLKVGANDGANVYHAIRILEKVAARLRKSFKIVED
jgi:hypothetical protein